MPLSFLASDGSQNWVLWVFVFRFAIEYSHVSSTAGGTISWDDSCHFPQTSLSQSSSDAAVASHVVSNQLEVFDVDNTAAAMNTREKKRRHPQIRFTHAWWPMAFTHDFLYRAVVFTFHVLMLASMLHSRQMSHTCVSCYGCTLTMIAQVNTFLFTCLITNTIVCTYQYLWVWYLYSWVQHCTWMNQGLLLVGGEIIGTTEIERDN